MIILLGATGSGKSKLRTKTLEKLDINKDVPHIGIDDIVEQSAGYRRRVIDILNKYHTGKEVLIRETDNGYQVTGDQDFTALKALVTSPTMEMLHDFEEAYFATRRQQSDVMHDAKFDEALKSKQNFTIELTGIRPFKWFIDLAIQNGYDVVVSTVILYLQALTQRNTTRASESLMNFMQDVNNNPVPRLPDVSPIALTGTVKQIYLNIIQVMKDCMKTQDDCQDCYCGDKGIGKMLIYDNSYADIILLGEITAQTKPTEISDMIDEVLLRVYKKQKTGGGGGWAWGAIAAGALLTAVSAALGGTVANN